MARCLVCQAGITSDMIPAPRLCGEHQAMERDGYIGLVAARLVGEGDEEEILPIGKGKFFMVKRDVYPKLFGKKPDDYPVEPVPEDVFEKIKAKFAGMDPNHLTKIAEAEALKEPEKQEIICSWCNHPIEGDATLYKNGTFHNECWTENQEVIQAAYEKTGEEKVTD